MSHSITDINRIVSSYVHDSRVLFKLQETSMSEKKVLFIFLSLDGVALLLTVSGTQMINKLPTLVVVGDPLSNSAN